MIVNRSDPQWLQQLLERAIAERWCMQINCRTCASNELRQGLGLLAWSSAGRPQFLQMTPEMADAIVSGLQVCAPKLVSRVQMEEAARWVLYEVWRNFGDTYFSRVDGSWAGDVLSDMRAHYQRREEARHIHDARQGVKKRDWNE
jgi:hypothetical protein